MKLADGPAAHWPWWLGALWLGAVVVAYRVAIGRDLGVSGLIKRALDLRGERARRRAERGASAEAMERALIAATLEEMRAAGLDPDEQSEPSEQPDVALESAAAAPPPRLPWSAAPVFLLGLVGGGAVAEMAAPSAFGAKTAVSSLWGSGWCGSLALLAGGLLVGFGARMAGGCTSGHGLCGSSRLDRSSLVATACFFAGGIAVTLLAGRS
jgi:uncharacterized protein